MTERLTDIRRSLLKECGVIELSFRANIFSRKDVKNGVQPLDINHKKDSFDGLDLVDQNTEDVVASIEKVTSTSAHPAFSSSDELEADNTLDSLIEPADTIAHSQPKPAVATSEAGKSDSTEHAIEQDSNTEMGKTTPQLDKEPLEGKSPTVSLQRVAVVAVVPVNQEHLAEVATEVAECALCAPPKEGQIRALGFGQESNPKVMIVLNPASMREMKEGKLLSGRAGLMFSHILRAIGIDESNGYYCHATSCGVIQKVGEIEMAKRCRSHLQRKINAIQPNIVLALGEIAAQSVLTTSEPLERLRNETHTLDSGILVRASYHPFDLLDRPANKARAWQDIRTILPLMNEVD